MSRFPEGPGEGRFAWEVELAALSSKRCDLPEVAVGAAHEMLDPELRIWQQIRRSL